MKVKIMNWKNAFLKAKTKTVTKMKLKALKFSLEKQLELSTAIARLARATWFGRKAFTENALAKQMEMLNLWNASILFSKF